MPHGASVESADATGEMETHQHGLRVQPSHAPAAPAMPVAVPAPPRAAPAEPPAAKHPSPAKGSAKGAKSRAERDAEPVSIPVSVVPSEASPLEADIRRLTRIIFSDIVIYGPEKADKAIRQGRFAEAFKTEIEEGRKIIRSRFSSDTASALGTFQRCLEELLEARKKELTSALAL
jgi:hypothetical protein